MRRSRVFADTYGKLSFQRKRCYGIVEGLPAVPRERVTEALKAARRLHAGQLRGFTKFPYVTHVYHVVAILIEEMKVEDADVLVAGALHDVVEDCGVPIGELTERFGRRVATIVRSESENMFESRREYMEHFRKAPKSVMLVKTADRIDNLRFVAHEGVTAFAKGKNQGEETMWPLEKVVRYVIEAERYILPWSQRFTAAGHRSLLSEIGGFKEDRIFNQTYNELIADGVADFQDRA